MTIAWITAGAVLALGFYLFYKEVIVYDYKLKKYGEEKRKFKAR